MLIQQSAKAYAEATVPEPIVCPSNNSDSGSDEEASVQSNKAYDLEFMVQQYEEEEEEQKEEGEEPEH